MVAALFPFRRSSLSSDKPSCGKAVYPALLSIVLVLLVQVFKLILTLLQYFDTTSNFEICIYILYVIHNIGSVRRECDCRRYANLDKTSQLNEMIIVVAM